jgi:hypothetical protein
VTSRSWRCSPGADLNGCVPRTGPLRPATNRPARVRTRTGEFGARHAPAYTTGLEKRRSLRQESNPHLGRTKGACLPLTLRRLEWRRRESNPLLLGASEALCHQSFIPEVRTGGVEPPQHEAAGLQAVGLTNAQRPRGGVTDRSRTGTARLTTSGARRLHHGHHEGGGDRTRTGGLSPDKRALSLV